MPHHVDMHVGLRIRHCRWTMGMSQDQLGARTGLGLDQIQQCEQGGDVTGASRLAAIAAALEVPVAFLFEGLDTETADAGEKRAAILLEPEAMELVRAYYELPPNHRKGLVDLARTLRNATR